jgi:hypothetical protein
MAKKETVCQFFIFGVDMDPGIQFRLDVQTPAGLYCCLNGSHSASTLPQDFFLRIIAGIQNGGGALPYRFADGHNGVRRIDYDIEPLLHKPIGNSLANLPVPRITPMIETPVLDTGQSVDRRVIFQQFQSRVGPKRDDLGSGELLAQGGDDRGFHDQIAYAIPHAQQYPSNKRQMHSMASCFAAAGAASGRFAAVRCPLSVVRCPFVRLASFASPLSSILYPLSFILYPLSFFL